MLAAVILGFIGLLGFVGLLELVALTSIRGFSVQLGNQVSVFRVQVSGKHRFAVAIGVRIAALEGKGKSGLASDL